MAGVPGDLHRQRQDRRVRAPAGRSRRAVELSSRDDAERRGPDRLPIEPAACLARPRHAAGDAAAAPGGLGRLRPHHSARQPERQAVRPQRAGWDHRNGVRFRSQPLGGAGRGVRGVGRGCSRGGTRVAIGARTHNALPSRHRQDGRHGDRGGRPDPQGRAGAFGLVRDPRALSWHSGPDSANGDAG